MADRYYDAQATGANNGTSWIDAFETSNAAATAAGVGDTIWTSHTSAESPGGSVILAVTGEVFVSVNAAGSVPPVEADYLRGAAIAISGISDILIDGGHGYFRGFDFSLSDDCILRTGQVLFEDCTLLFTSVNARFTAAEGFIRLLNTDLTFNTTSGLVELLGASNFLMEGGKVYAPAGTVQLIREGTNGGQTALLKGVDLSEVSLRLVQFLDFSSPQSCIFEGCLLKAGVVLTVTTNKMTFAALYGSSATNQPYLIQEAVYEGDIITETTVVKTGGSSDSVFPISLKYVTNANARISYYPLKNRMPILFWADTIGNNTFEVDVLTDNITLQTDEAWMEVNHPQAGIQRANETTRVIDGGALPTSAATWTTTGIGTPIKQKISITVNVGQKGWVEAFICFALPSSIMYADIKLKDSNRQYLAGQAYINTEAVSCDFPAVGEVTEGTVFDDGNLTGTYKEVPESKAEFGFDYGAGGVEFTGTLAAFTAAYELPQEIILEDQEILIFKGCD